MLRPLLFLIFLSGCSQFVPETLRALDDINPLTADPGDFQIHLTLPDGLDITPDSARLTLTAQSGDQKIDDEFALRRQDTRDGMLILTVAHRDLAPLRRIQQQARAWETVDPRGTIGSLGLDLGLCLRGAGPDPAAPVSAGLVLEKDGATRPLFGPQPVGRYLKLIKKSAGREIGICPPMR